MTAEILLQRLEKVKKTGLDKWSACCPAHDDKGPSLAVREVDRGRILIHCFAGCSFGEILDSLGMTPNDLYPDKVLNAHSIKPVHRPWSAHDALFGTAYESVVLLQIANLLATGVPLTDADHIRLRLATTRIQRAYEVTQ